MISIVVLKVVVVVRRSVVVEISYQVVCMHEAKTKRISFSEREGENGPLTPEGISCRGVVESGGPCGGCTRGASTESVVSEKLRTGMMV